MIVGDHMQKAVGTLIVIMRALALNHTNDVVWCGVVCMDMHVPSSIQRKGREAQNMSTKENRSNPGVS